MTATFARPVCPIYQNVTAEPSDDPETIQKRLVEQLTGPVRWTQTILNMISGGAATFIESGPGNVLQALVRKTDRTVTNAPTCQPFIPRLMQIKGTPNPVRPPL